MITTINQYMDERGTLTPISFERLLPFFPHRVFFLTGAKSRVKRGGHAHKTCKQYLVVVEGWVDVFVENKEGRHIHCMRPGTGLMIETHTWVEIQFRRKKCVVAVFCSHEYDESDYIYDRDQLFLL